MRLIQTFSYNFVGAVALIWATNASAQVTASSPMTSPNSNGPGIDFQNASPFPLPQAGQRAPAGVDALRNAVDPAQIFGRPGASRGERGTGETNPAQLAPAQKIPESLVTPEGQATISKNSLPAARNG
jgi:hypothetical protein